MAASYQPMNIGSHWQTMNANLGELVDLIPDGKLEWSPREGEWSFRAIFAHIVLARYHHVLVGGLDGATMSEIVATSQTHEGLKKSLATSWDIIERFITDAGKLNATYSPPNNDPMYEDPEVYDGHFLAYHRFAHDLHHRSTIVGYLSELGVSLDGRRIRPL